MPLRIQHLLLTECDIMIEIRAIKHTLTAAIPYYLHHWVGRLLVHLDGNSDMSFKQPQPPQLWKASKIQEPDPKILLHQLCHIYY